MTDHGKPVATENRARLVEMMMSAIAERASSIEASLPELEANNKCWSIVCEEFLKLFASEKTVNPALAREMAATQKIVFESWLRRRG